jgi:hypothetical protein
MNFYLLPAGEVPAVEEAGYVPVPGIPMMREAN